MNLTEFVPDIVAASLGFSCKTTTQSSFGGHFGDVTTISGT
jgi:hypothetical protein